MNGTRLKIKIDHHPLLIANIPLLHHSITGFQMDKTNPRGEIKAWSFRSGFFTFDALLKP